MIVTDRAAELVLFTTRTRGQCLVLKSWLSERTVAYREISVEDDPVARRFVRVRAGGYLSVRTVVLPDGTALVEPAHRELAAALVT